MGWKKCCYERRQKRKHFKTRPAFPNPDGLDFVLERYVFRPHFFDSYRSRV